MQTLSCSFAVVLVLILATHDEVSALPRPCYFLAPFTPTTEATTPTSSTTESTIEQLENIRKNIGKLITVERTSDSKSKVPESETGQTQGTSPKSYQSVPNPFEELISNYIKFISNLFTL